VTGNTGLLTQRCDPFGMENGHWGEQLAGGVLNDMGAGKYKWYCKQPAAGRFRMVCVGGDYGHRLQNDGGLIRAFHCDGGHKGQVMPLCKTHVSEFSVGPPPPGFTRDLKTPVGQVGGTRANEMCPACMWPAEARELQDVADRLQQELSRYMILGLMSEFARVTARQDQIRARMDELFATGRVHKCPLKLVEVS
jgi:hypothetical protein